ncbi:MAG: methyltransferase domain-containing protein [Chitinophagaceae bacterium]|nr:methyltransferase domain-containing protein [Chitinophagaceae bacterium]
MDKAYFNEYYHLERKNWWFTVRRKILSERIEYLLGKPRNITSLNVGAATGTTSDMLTRFGQVTSVEYDVDCCNFAKTYMTTPILQGSITELPFPKESFDLVCAFDVIEHVENDHIAVEELIRVCKPGGHIVVTVPAYAFLWGPHDIINQHYRRYTLKELVQLFGSRKGRIIYKTYFNAILFVPIASFRLDVSLCNRFIKKKESKGMSDHQVFGTAGVFNSLLAGLFNIDYYLLKAGLHLPTGVSIMIVFKKS